MPFKLLTAEDKPPAMSRVLISGPPMSLKTTATLSWPRPNHHFSMPGEKGWETVPTNVPGIIPYVWQFEDAEQMSARLIVQEVESAVFATAAKTLKELGDWRTAKWTLTLDGIHKLYGWHRLMHLADLRVSSSYAAAEKKGLDPEEAIGGPSYGRAHDSFGLFITKVLQLPIPYVVATVWEGKSKDDPDDRSKSAPSHTFPDLPGEMAKRIVGEFGITLYSSASKPDPKGNVVATWTVKPQGKIWGVGVHVDPRIARSVPPELPARFKALEPYLLPKDSSNEAAKPQTETQEAQNGNE